MKLYKRWYFATGAIVFLLGMAYFIWNSMNLHGNWLNQAKKVNIEWYDMKGIRHFNELSDAQKAVLTSQLEKIDVERKLYFLPEPRSGEQSYKIYYHGTKNVCYTIKSSGLIIVQNMDFPYQHSIWKINLEDINGIIEWIKGL